MAVDMTPLDTGQRQPHPPGGLSDHLIRWEYPIASNHRMGEGRLQATSPPATSTPYVVLPHIQDEGSGRDLTRPRLPDSLRPSSRSRPYRLVGLHSTRLGQPRVSALKVGRPSHPLITHTHSSPSSYPATPWVRG